jgi:hypothetical protein
MENTEEKVLRRRQTFSEEKAKLDPSYSAHTSLQGSSLVFARITWVVVVVLVLGLSLVSIPTYFDSLHHLVNAPHPPDLGGPLTTSAGVQDLQAVGLSLDFYARYSILLTFVFLFVSVAIGTVIFWRRSDDRMALLASFTLVLFPIAINTVNLDTLPPAWTLPIQSLQFLAEICLGLFFYLFPGGQFVPRWIRWIAVAMIAYWAADIFLPSAQFSASPLSFVLFLGFGASQVVVQLYRYRSASTLLERQQTKWVVFGIAMGLGGTLVEIVVVYAILELYFNLHMGALAWMLTFAIQSFLTLLFPLSIGIAMLRSRLWDIDILINRTLVYSMLTASLALLYVGLVLALQFLLRGLISQTSDIAIVGSTLAIAALFQPLRHHFQRVIDRRFYRQKYDATRTLAVFSAALRNEVDLEQLSEQLVAVVEETMQPTHVSLWLRQPYQYERRRERVLSE